MAWSEMRCAAAGIVAVFFGCLQLSVGEDGFQLLESDCGRMPFSEEAGLRIIDGANADFGAHPWMALVHTSTSYLCAGSLINQWFVLTAAHCIEDDSSLAVRLGEYNRSQTVDCQGNFCMDPYEEYDVDVAFRHKFYDSKSQINDIGMLRLDRRVTYNTHIQPICVFVDSKIKPVVDILTWFDATGWGKTSPKGWTSSVLQQLKLNRRPYEDCERMFSQRLSSMQLCFGNDKSNLCNGDSGGPQGREMSYNNSRIYVQLGIASFTNLQCQNVSILTDVLSHGNWIKRVVQRFGVQRFGVPEDGAEPAERQPLERKPTFYYPI